MSVSLHAFTFYGWKNPRPRRYGQTRSQSDSLVTPQILRTRHGGVFHGGHPTQRIALPSVGRAQLRTANRQRRGAGKNLRSAPRQQIPSRESADQTSPLRCSPRAQAPSRPLAGQRGRAAPVPRQRLSQRAAPARSAANGAAQPSPWLSTPGPPRRARGRPPHRPAPETQTAAGILSRPAAESRRQEGADPTRARKHAERPTCLPPPHAAQPAPTRRRAPPPSPGGGRSRRRFPLPVPGTAPSLPRLQPRGPALPAGCARSRLYRARSGRPAASLPLRGPASPLTCRRRGTESRPSARPPNLRPRVSLPPWREAAVCAPRSERSAVREGTPALKA